MTASRKSIIIYGIIAAVVLLLAVTMWPERVEQQPLLTEETAVEEG